MKKNIEIEAFFSFRGFAIQERRIYKDCEILLSERNLDLRKYFLEKSVEPEQSADGVGLSVCQYVRSHPLPTGF